jgi:hypothetical protein
MLRRQHEKMKVVLERIGFAYCKISSALRTPNVCRRPKKKKAHCHFARAYRKMPSSPLLLRNWELDLSVADRKFCTMPKTECILVLSCSSKLSNCRTELCSLEGSLSPVSVSSDSVSPPLLFSRAISKIHLSPFNSRDLRYDSTKCSRNRKCHNRLLPFLRLSFAAVLRPPITGVCLTRTGLFVIPSPEWRSSRLARSQLDVFFQTWCPSLEPPLHRRAKARTHCAGASKVGERKPEDLALW